MKAVQAKDSGLAGTLTAMRRIDRLFALGVVVVLLAAAVEGHQRRAYTGRRVADVLRELQSRAAAHHLQQRSGSAGARRQGRAKARNARATSRGRFSRRTA